MKQKLLQFNKLGIYDYDKRIERTFKLIQTAALVAKVVQIYSDNGHETNTTHDHKKVLKIFSVGSSLDL